jgi:hypothetical protein
VSNEPDSQEQQAVDFTELSTGLKGEKLEQLTRLLAQKEGFQTSWTGRGADGGMDLKLVEKLSGPMTTLRIAWLVSCKDHSVSGKSVAEAEAGEIRDKVDEHKANGFLLVTTTTVGTALKTKLDKLDIKQGGQIHTQVWDSATLTVKLLQPGNEDIFKGFFPKSYKRLRKASPDEAFEILKENLPRSVFEEIQAKVSPYLVADWKWSGSDVSPLDDKVAGIINEVIRLLVEEDDVSAAASHSRTLSNDMLADFAQRLLEDGYDLCEEFLATTIPLVHDPLKALNLFQLLVENFEVDRCEWLRLGTFLDSDGLQIMFSDKLQEWLQDELICNGSHYGSFWSDIDELSSGSTIETIWMTQIEFDAKPGQSVEFEGDMELEVGLYYGSARDGAYHCIAFPGKFRGNFDIVGGTWLLEEVSVDTSSYYE